MHARLELHRIAWLPAAAILLAFVGGCAQRSRGPDTVTDCGRIYMFPGIEGNRWSLSWACAGLRDAGVNSAIRVVDWDRPLGGLANLTDYEGNRRLARRVASDIAEYRATYRTAPIDLLGYSGGGGLAVLVAEELPEGICVRNVVLAQPALSPEYDLTLALRRIDGKLVNFYSPHDWLILGLGTRFFGTIDRAKTMSAGKERINLSRAVHDERLHTEGRAGGVERADVRNGAPWWARGDSELWMESALGCTVSARRCPGIRPAPSIRGDAGFVLRRGPLRTRAATAAS